ncbi:MAG: hypothetical protein MUO76_21190 [Anaerolineaceae bacterium]|nr:hypothetical protein [Anaerolineaceae bacterium]
MPENEGVFPLCQYFKAFIEIRPPHSYSNLELLQEMLCELQSPRFDELKRLSKVQQMVKVPFIHDEG